VENRYEQAILNRHPKRWRIATSKEAQTLTQSRDGLLVPSPNLNLQELKPPGLEEH